MMNDKLLKAVGILVPNADCDISDGVISRWGDVGKKPTQQELDTAILSLSDIEYKDLRKDEYAKQGLSFESFIEMLIEGDNAGMAQYRSARQAIKDEIPKPL